MGDHHRRRTNRGKSRLAGTGVAGDEPEGRSVLLEAEKRRNVSPIALFVASRFENVLTRLHSLVQLGSYRFGKDDAH